MNDTPDSKSSRGSICKRWWLGMQKKVGNGTKNHNAQPGALASLRRAANAMEAAQLPQTIALYRDLYGNRFDEDNLRATAIVAAVLAHIREEPAKSATPTATRLGKGDPKPMSELRMRRLTAARNERETLRGFREVVALLKNKADVADIAESVLDWLGPENQANSRKIKWLYAYHAAAQAAPEQISADKAAENPA